MPPIKCLLQHIVLLNDTEKLAWNYHVWPITFRSIATIWQPIHCPNSLECYNQDTRDLPYWKLADGTWNVIHIIFSQDNLSQQATAKLCARFPTWFKLTFSKRTEFWAHNWNLHKDDPRNPKEILQGILILLFQLIQSKHTMHSHMQKELCTPPRTPQWKQQNKWGKEGKRKQTPASSSAYVSPSAVCLHKRETMIIYKLWARCWDTKAHGSLIHISWILHSRWLQPSSLSPEQRHQQAQSACSSSPCAQQPWNQTSRKIW